MEKTLFQALRAFRSKDVISFHMPGHKHGAGLSRAFKKYGMSIDVTEFEETDNLQEPISILKDAETRAAKTFGAGQSFFLTDGSSVGLHAAILGSTKPGDTVLVDRTCHRAVIAALVMGGLKPYFLYPKFDKNFALYRGITERAVKCALEDCPDAVGAVVTSPSYYGVCSDVWGIAACLHKYGKFLIIDEAHGAHFAFSSALPQTALLQGADLCVQSAHKTLPALGQTALLHVGKNSLIPADLIQRQLQILHTTSPSYLFMTSLDEAVVQMNKMGEKRIARLFVYLEQLKKRIRKKTVLQIVDEKVLHCPQDGLRLLVDFRKSGITGFHAAQMLKDVFHIYPEMADSRYVVLIITVANTKDELKKLEQALYFMGTTIFVAEDYMPIQPLLPPVMACLPAAAWNADRKTVPLEEAEGEVCAEIVGICPPGAAVLLPGQRIDAQTIAYLQRYEKRKTVDVTAEQVIKCNG